MPGLSFGAGFFFMRLALCSSALANAVVARADDLSAIFYNPAGLTQLRDHAINGDLMPISPELKLLLMPDRLPLAT